MSAAKKTDGSFSYRTQETAEGLEVFFAGKIDENMQFSTVKVPPAQIMIFDFADVLMINSIGIREWVRWIRQLPGNVIMKFRRCPRAVVEQINILEGFLPKGARVESFFVPYYCEKCDQTHNVLYEKDRQFRMPGHGRSASAPASGSVHSLSKMQGQYGMRRDLTKVFPLSAEEIECRAGEADE